MEVRCAGFWPGSYSTPASAAAWRALSSAAGTADHVSYALMYMLTLQFALAALPCSSAAGAGQLHNKAVLQMHQDSCCDCCCTVPWLTSSPASSLGSSTPTGGDMGTVYPASVRRSLDLDVAWYKGSTPCTPGAVVHAVTLEHAAYRSLL